MEEKKFYKYPEIENSYQEGFVQRIKDDGFGDIPYIVMEKIHGSNSQVTYNLITKEFALGTRNNPLLEGEKFYNLEKCVEPFKEKIVKLADKLYKDLSFYGQRLVSITLFGEIFGGSYPHKEVPMDKTAIKVQKAVFYSPSNQWLAFDVGYVVAGSECMYFLPGSLFITSCCNAGIPIVPILASVETLDDALAYQNNGESLVYDRYELPKIEGNIMEGIVIRPLMHDIWFGHNRLILKSKNDKFKEKWKAKKDEVPVELPEKVKQAIEEISQYINRNRVHNVISKIGEVTVKDVGKVIMLTSQDVLNDYRKDYDTLDFIEKKDEKMVTKYMNGEIAKCVRDVIVFGME